MGKTKLFIHSVELDLSPTKELQEFYDSLASLDKNFKVGETKTDEKGNTYYFLIPCKKPK